MNERAATSQHDESMTDTRKNGTEQAIPHKYGTQVFRRCHTNLTVSYSADAQTQREPATDSLLLFSDL